VFQRLGHALTLLAVLTVMGLHWAVLQSVAWERMLAENLGRTPLFAALQETFDGKHPCALCKAIAVGKNSEQKKDIARQHGKLEFPPQQAVPQPSAPASFQLLIPGDTFADSFATAPPVPPPRSLFA
jgi:hypothetical protein